MLKNINVDIVLRRMSKSNIMLATSRLLYKVSEALVWIVFMVTTMTRSVASNLKIDPSGPVAVFDLSKSSQHSKEIVLTCTSTENLNITWEIPTFNFAELNNRSEFTSLWKEGKTENDLFRRVEISTSPNKNKDGFTSILTIRNQTTWDEGYYTCLTTNTNTRISSRIYIFLPGLRKPTNLEFDLSRNAHVNRRVVGPSYQDVDPIKSFYVVQEPSSTPIRKSSIIIPCLIRGLTGISSERFVASTSYYESSKSPILLSETGLQRKNVADGEKWKQVVNRNKIRNWTYNKTFQGFELFFDEEDAGHFGTYRCFIEEIHEQFSIGRIRFISEPFAILVEAKIGQAENSKPIIRPLVKFLVFQSGSTFNLTCEINRSKGNISWLLPESRIPPATRTSKDKTTWTIKENDVTSATLTVSNAAYSDTGYYTCQNVQNEELFSELYVFVQDLDTLMTFTFFPYNHRIQSLIGSSLTPFHILKEPPFRVMVVAPFSFPVVVRIIQTSPFIIDIKLYRIVGGKRQSQVYPSTKIEEESNWSYDMFEGFKMKHSSWDISGEYEVDGSYEQYDVLQHNGPRTIGQRHFILPFSIHVAGIEMTSSEIQAIEGKSFSINCQWRFPFEFVLYQRRAAFDWYWTPSHQNQEYSHQNFHQKLGTEMSNWGDVDINTNRINPERIYNSILIFQNLTLEANGTFRCILNYSSFYNPAVDGNLIRNYQMNVLVEKVPVITVSNPDSGTLGVDIGDENVTLSCQVDAVPAAEIHCTNGQGFLGVNDKFNIFKDDSRTTLTFRVTSSFNSSGEEFTCHFTNSEGSARKTFKIHLNGGLDTGSIVGIVFAVSLFLLLLGLLSRSIYWHKKRDKLIRITRERLLNGDPGRFDPEIPLEEQVNLLPYDSQWEVPRSSIILGKQLGAGQFGVVVLAKQIGTIHDPQDNKMRTVAVKLVKSLNTTSLESLASELKIMIHLGPHLNVVNLLGACTKNIANGELLVIEEFCRFGNVHDYLIANRDYFINELDKTKEVQENSEVSLPLLQEPGHYQEERGEYLTMTQLDGPEGNFMQPRSSLFDSFVQNATRESVLFRITNQKDDDHDAILHHNEYLLPSNVDNLESEEMTSTRNGKRNVAIRTRDLINWSFQIACGMNHLKNKKVIHGDLAARNVLLADGNVIKIADFGLSRQTKYNDGTYLKKGEEALPVKWMAIESLTDRIFTTQSDAWSYGVVLWELFSLCKMPYSEVTILKDLISLLRNGERLEKPLFIPDSVNQVMAKCWENDPKKRPSFSQLEKELGSMLGNDIQSHYLKMNAPYMEMNSRIPTS